MGLPVFGLEYSSIGPWGKKVRGEEEDGTRVPGSPCQENRQRGSVFVKPGGLKREIQREGSAWRSSAREGGGREGACRRLKGVWSRERLQLPA